MLSLINNMLAMNAGRQLRQNFGKRKTAIEKLSSGYRVCRAADDAAGLAISEKMRRQIRGLTQGTANAQDGVSFVQVADGAMNEVHDMLQRMNELAIRSMNDTCSDNDRIALNAELKQLLTEIDRIGKCTTFNEQRVFEEHENSHYQLRGNKVWDPEQVHVISASTNDLSIHMPTGFVPPVYTLSVTPGAYSTLELIDELDSALERMQPPNPGFVLEQTENGLIQLTFEGKDRYACPISSVEGSLSYLFFDSRKGSSSAALLGTTVFEAGYPLNIRRGQNDDLQFTIEKPGIIEDISMTIPEGAYTRSEIIDLINQELAKNPNADGVAAKEYGASSIQIAGEGSVNITGLKGNMFKIETTNPVYSSVFYDNINYGGSSATNAYLQGYAYYAAGITDKFHLSAANQNNVLRLKANDATDYMNITFADKPGGYTLEEIKDILNANLKDQGIAEANLYTTSISVPTSPTQDTYEYRYPNGLYLTSLVQGSESAFEFDMADPVSKAAFETIFRHAAYLPLTFNGKRAEIIGSASLNGEITLSNDATLTFHITDMDGSIKSYTITGLGGTYANSEELARKLNESLDALQPTRRDVSPSSIKDKIEFFSNGNGFGIKSKNDDIASISFGSSDPNDIYNKLFVGKSESINIPPSYGYYHGEISNPQGSTGFRTTPAVAWANVAPAALPIEVTSDSNQLGFQIFGNYGSITLSEGRYGSMNALVAEMNKKFAEHGDALVKRIRASYEGGQLKLTSMPPEGGSNGYYYLEYQYPMYSSTLWKAILGTTPGSVSPTEVLGSKSCLQTFLPIPDNVSIDDGNHSLKLTLANGASADANETIAISNGTYSKEALKDALQEAINRNAALNGKITVSLTAKGKLELGHGGYSLKAEGGFYDKVLITGADSTEYYYKGTCYYTEPYIVGRKDLTAEPVDIVRGANDQLIFDFTSPSVPSGGGSKKQTFEITIPEGIYSGNQIAKILQDKINEEYDPDGTAALSFQVTIGGKNTGVVGANDDTALQISLIHKKDPSTGNYLEDPASGQYILDGVRGSAATFLFYKTTGAPQKTYITGTKNLLGGVYFPPGQNVLTFSVDSEPYRFTFQAGKRYTADEFIGMLNDRFATGDDNGNTVPLRASLDKGFLKLSHRVIGAHSITDIGGSARCIVFLAENYGNRKGAMNLLVGAEAKDALSIPRIRMGTSSLSISSILISKKKYAEKAIRRIGNALVMMSDKRSLYGAMQNRLEHTVDNNNNVIENTQASESVIRDADIAREAMAQAKYHILMQASQTILAQANQSSGMVLSLLQPS